MKKRRSLNIIGCILIVILLILTAMVTLGRVMLIIKFGIVAANSLKTITILFGVIVFLLMAINNIPALIASVNASSNKKKSQDLGLQYRSKKSGPEEIREQLELAMKQRASLSGKIDRCILQLDEIEKQLERFDRLIRINEAVSLESAREALEETQRTICSNLKWVINSNVAASEHDDGAISRLNENIDEVLEANTELLNKDEEFLLDVADHLSEVKGSGQTFQLDAWRETISQFNQKFLMGDGK